jgi:hypothetical protein
VQPGRFSYLLIAYRSHFDSYLVLSIGEVRLTCIAPNSLRSAELQLTVAAKSFANGASNMDIRRDKRGRTLLKLRYYTNQSVRWRIEEFLGFDSVTGDNPSCVFATVGDSYHTDYISKPTRCSILSNDNDPVEIYRSMWDREALIADLDIEYVNFDFPAEPFLNPERAFALQEPVRVAALVVFAKSGLRPLHLASGRGHHFTWQIARQSRAFKSLSEIGRPFCARSDWAGWIKETEESREDYDLCAAFCGLGLLMEFIVHQIKAMTRSASRIPVEVTAIEVVPNERGREMISLDISEYGDPICARTIRAAFSRYLKPFKERTSLSKRLLKELPLMFEIPFVTDVRTTINTMRNRERVLALASETCVRIPDQSEASAELLKSYCESPLAKFHKIFLPTGTGPPGPGTGGVAPDGCDATGKGVEQLPGQRRAGQRQ